MLSNSLSLLTPQTGTTFLPALKTSSPKCLKRIQPRESRLSNASSIHGLPQMTLSKTMLVTIHNFCMKINSKCFAGLRTSDSQSAFKLRLSPSSSTKLIRVHSTSPNSGMPSELSMPIIREPCSSVRFVLPSKSSICQQQKSIRCLSALISTMMARSTTLNSLL